MSSKRIRYTFDVHFSSQEEKKSFTEKIDGLKKKIGTIKDIFHYIFEKTSDTSPESSSTRSNKSYNPFYTCTKENAKDPIIMTVPCSLQKLIECVRHFGCLKCDPDGEPRIRVASQYMYEYTCELSAGDKCLLWKSSPYINHQQKFLVNCRVAVGLQSSCILTDQFRRFCSAIQCGQPTDNFLKQTFDITSSISSTMAKECIQTAQQEATERAGDDGVTVETDATFSASRNAFKSNIFGLDYHTHKIVGSVVMTRENNPIPHRHETMATRMLHEQWQEDNFKVRCNLHDSNLSVSKVIEEMGVTEQHCCWHKIKNDVKKLKDITHGPKKMDGKTWSSQLIDKHDGIKNHLWFCVYYSAQSEELLRDSLDAIVLHYQGIHDNCRLTSPCVSNPKYSPSRQQLTDSVAIDLLTKWIRGTSIYQKPDLVLEGLSTSYIESCKGALRSFCPKKQSFANDNYKHRTNMFVLDWNTNIGRPYHRRTSKELIGTLRENSGSIVKVQKSYAYQQEIRSRYLDLTIV